MAIKALIFDMGGVLIKTTDKNPRRKLAESLNLTYSELDQLVYGSNSAISASLGEISERDHFMAVIHQLGLDSSEFSRFREEFWGGDRLDEELVEFIRQQKANYQLAMLSNAMSDTRNWLELKYNFLHLFDVIYFSAEQRMAKPDPIYYERLLEELKIKAEESIFVDDFIENIHAAQELGMHAVHYRSTPQTIAEIKKFL